MGEERKDPKPPSFGNMSDDHWSRARKDKNQEALNYYRERSKAPGVADGGAARNFYCMSCAGVLDFDTQASACPHCGAVIEGGARRYFNWVEMDEPKKSDFLVLMPWLVAGLVLLAVLATGLVFWLL